MEIIEVSNKLQEIVQRVLDNKINYITIDDLLDERDEDVFSLKWMNEYDAIESLKTKHTHQDLSFSLRERIFKEVYNQCGNSELAGYVSDDFGLLIDAVAVHHKSTWLNALLNSYALGMIPKGDIGESEGELVELIAKI